MHQYPSDITREQFEIIRKDLEGFKKTTRPRTYDLYDIFCAILYVVKSGIQWRMLPSDFPKWQLVYYYFRLWSDKPEEPEAGKEILTLLERVLQKLVKEIRNEDLRKDKTTFGIIDAQSVQNADSAKEKGYDAGKKLLE